MSLMRGARATILDAVGRTPIVKLNKIGQHTKAELYVKCEYLNPGGSMKDRVAINIVNDAEARGALKPGGTIVEATSGNTGMGLALVAAVRGYKSIFVMPDKMSDEKIRALRAVGAKVVITPTNVEPEDPRSYYSVARRLSEETPNAMLANQYHNPANPEAHYKSTGPEIWGETGGEFDVFVAGLGTGGTISGAGRYFKEQKPSIKIVGVDPIGSLYYDYFKTGKLLQMSKAAYKVEGIGEDFLPSTVNFKVVDEVIRVTDAECFATARDLVRREGILCGGSAGAAVAGAVRYAETLERPARIVVHLPDSALRYLTKYLDDEWMRENGFAGGTASGLGTVRDLFGARGVPQVETASPKDSIKAIVRRMKEHGISQLPVVDEQQIRGIVAEGDLLDYLVQGKAKADSEIGPLVETNFAVVDLATPVTSLSKLFNQGEVLIVLDRDRRVEPRSAPAGESTLQQRARLDAAVIVGVITKIDLIEYMTDRLV